MPCIILGFYTLVGGAALLAQGPVLFGGAELSSNADDQLYDVSFDPEDGDAYVLSQSGVAVVPARRITGDETQSSILRFPISGLNNPDDATSIRGTRSPKIIVDDEYFYIVSNPTGNSVTERGRLSGGRSPLLRRFDKTNGRPEGERPISGYAAILDLAFLNERLYVAGNRNGVAAWSEINLSSAFNSGASLDAGLLPGATALGTKILNPKIESGHIAAFGTCTAIDAVRTSSGETRVFVGGYYFLKHPGDDDENMIRGSRGFLASYASNGANAVFTQVEKGWKSQPEIVGPKRKEFDGNGHSDRYPKEILKEKTRFGDGHGPIDVDFDLRLNGSFIQSVKAIRSGGGFDVIVLEEYRKIRMDGAQTPTSGSNPDPSGSEDEYSSRLVRFEEDPWDFDNNSKLPGNQPGKHDWAGNQYTQVVAISRYNIDFNEAKAIKTIHPRVDNLGREFDRTDYAARASALATDGEGNVFVSGIIPGAVSTAVEGHEEQQSGGADRLFVAKYATSGSRDLTCEEFHVFDHFPGQPQPTPYSLKRGRWPALSDSSNGAVDTLAFPGLTNGFVRPSVVAWNSELKAVMLVGSQGGQAWQGEILEYNASNKSWPVKPSDTLATGIFTVIDGVESSSVSGSFLTILDSELQVLSSQGLEITSLVEDQNGDSIQIGNNALIRPFVGGKRRLDVGDRVTVEAPEVVYQTASGRFLGSFEDPPPEATIRNEAVTRYVNEGYTVSTQGVGGGAGNESFFSPTNSYTFTYKEPIKVSFQWRVEHRLKISSDLSGTHGFLTDELVITDEDLFPLGDPLNHETWGVLFNSNTGILSGRVVLALDSGFGFEAGTSYVVEGPTIGSNLFQFRIAGSIARIFRNHNPVSEVRLKVTRRNPRVGLTSLASGNPSPAVGIHWTPHGEPLEAFIEGAALDPAGSGVRYRVTGYDSAELGNQEWASYEVRQQVGDHVVTGPLEITYQWSPQYRVQVSTSGTATSQFPEVRQGDGFNERTLGENGQGIGEHWFDAGASLRIGSYLGSGDKELRGWLFAQGTPFEDVPSGNLAQLKNDGDFYFREIEALDGSVTVTWDYGDTIYQFANEIDIGGNISFSGTLPRSRGQNPVPLNVDAIRRGGAGGDIREPDRIVVIQSPPGSSGPDMQLWDAKNQRALPLRPGRYLMEWDSAGENKTVVEVATRFPAQPNFRHVTHPEIPAINLDPDDDDAFMFLELAYSEGDGRVNGSEFRADQQGRHVLLFSKAAAGVARGDLIVEDAIVRVAETRNWNSDPSSSETNLGSWLNQIAGSNEPGGVRTVAGGSPMVMTARAAPVIGRTLREPGFDRAAIATGFVVHPLARYNANIYDRTRVADAGPIIPVNRHFTGRPEDDLVVIWYEHSNAAGASPQDTPSNILWPWQPAEYPNAEWPSLEGGLSVSTEVGGYQTVSGYEGIALSDDGSVAYAVSPSRDSLSVLSLGDPRNPAPLEEIGLGDPFEVVAEDDLLAVLSSTNTLTVFDISNPRVPQLLATIADDGEFNGDTYDGLSGLNAVTIDGGIIYATSLLDEAITLIDFRNPSDPKLLAKITSTRMDPSSQFDRLSGLRAAAVKGDLLCVAAERSNAITFMDVSDPNNVRRVGAEDIFGGSLITPWFLEISGDHLYVGDFNGVSIVDISDSDSPTLVNQFTDGTLDVNNAWGMTAAGDIVYVQTSDRTLAVDFGDPTNPIPRAIYRSDSFSANRGLEVFNGFGYVAAASAGIAVYELGDIEGVVGRIVIASRIGSEGHDAQGRRQLAFQSDRFSEVAIYNQPDPGLPGYNPNEEHAVIEPSLLFASSANRPPAAFALRSGDLNVTAQDASHTSEPRVLVEYFDGQKQEWGMAVYEVNEEDGSLGQLSVVFEDQSDVLSVTIDEESGAYLFRDATGLKFREGEQVVVDFESSLSSLTSGARLFVRAQGFSEFGLSAFPGGPVLEGDEIPEGLNISVRRAFNYTFDYLMEAGEPVQPPYPLGPVAGLTPCAENFGLNGSLSSESGAKAPRCYWEDFRGQAWAVSGGGNTLRGYFYYPLLDSFWPVIGGQKRDPGTCLRFLPESLADEFDRPHYAPGEDGLDDAEYRAQRETYPQAVTYTATWPDDLPILKVGETLTFAGGEYRLDNPESRGLPGVIGWASGKVIYDSMNPTMDNQEAFGAYSGRLIAPLEERRVDFPLSDDQLEMIAPATGITKVDRLVWKFEKLPASLQKRIFIDPIGRELGIVGFVNDKTLGDSTLTLAPPPVFVLEPNILAPSERDTLLNFKADRGETLTMKQLLPQGVWENAVKALYAKSRNPNGLQMVAGSDGDADAYYAGLEPDMVQENGQDKLNSDGSPMPITNTARPMNAFGPGLALVPSPALLEPGRTEPVYITVVENDDKEIGGPVTPHIIRIDPKHRYRGAIKTIIPDNIFSEKITLRHTGDFGANADDVVYQWFYREEDGTTASLPPGDPWKLFLDQRGILGPKGLRMNQISVEGTGGLILADNLFFARYRHLNDLPLDGSNGIDWSATEWATKGQEAAVVDRDGKPVRDEGGIVEQALQGEWAGAANSPTVDGEYRPQLVTGWIKRVLDRINPYEARFNDFRNNDAPATYVSMIRQAGRPFEGPVALNPDKDVIENVGLIELYQTLLDRSRDLSLDLSSPISTPGINTAILLAATRLSDLYMLLGNEAFSDAIDPTIGFDGGSAPPDIFSFQNQVATLLDEELAMLRGVDDSYGRPVYNRLFWNFTKSDGEVAYALNYNLQDLNHDGFIDESDALLQFPQGHGDAWGHYSSALRMHYDLLRNPFFNWISRTEFYNLLDVVVNVDFLDERKFAAAAAARAKAGAEVVDLTYRSRYVENPDGQWQGYTDVDKDRSWGVEGWARRAGQAAYLDWLTANALVPEDFDDFNASRPRRQQIDDPSTLQRIDRSSVTTISQISAQLARIQNTYDDANVGMNPLGLSRDAVPFDIRGAALDPNVGFHKTHFEQVYERAETALENAQAAFASANKQENRIRDGINSTDEFSWQVRQEDRAFRNRLIEIFGSPYTGQIGTGKAYPPGYSGPDLFLWMYVDVKDVDASTVPPPNGLTVEQAVDLRNGSITLPLGVEDGTFVARWQGFEQQVLSVDDGRFKSILKPFFASDGAFAIDAFGGITNVELFDNRSLVIDMPIRASGYTFAAPDDWKRRQSTGELQSIIQDLVQTEADVLLAVGDYEFLLADITDKMAVVEARHNVAIDTLKFKEGRARDITGVKTALEVNNHLIRLAKATAEEITEKSETLYKITSKITGTGTTTIVDASPTTAASFTSGETIKKALQISALGLESTNDKISFGADIAALWQDIEFEESGLGGSIKGALKELEIALRNEATVRIEVFKKVELLRQISDRYRTVLNESVSLLDEREDYNRRVAGVTQKVRYQDMAFRIFRNEALQRYRSSFDLAQDYAYLAAKAYDYETNLAPDDPASAQALVGRIIQARHPGSGNGGLGSALSVLKANFDVLKGRLGLDNPQTGMGRVSLRREALRIKGDGDYALNPDDPIASVGVDISDDQWVEFLSSQRKDDLWQVPEFVRYCRPPAPRSDGPQPGIVIPFGTQIIQGNNFFGWELAAGDRAYNPTNFATKIRGVGVWFEGYDPTQLAFAPQVYLVPVGLDVMTVPNSGALKTRSWTVVDQAIPIPFPVRPGDLEGRNWQPLTDTLTGPFAEIRQFSSFRANWTPGSETGALPPPDDEMVFDTRLVGRSVWNTRWLLIIPGKNLLYDGEEGLNRFKETVTDIKFAFRTYGYSGN